MTNVNDTEADLGLAVVTNQWKNNSNTTAGAGANANSKADMMRFMGSDTLAELVWSPRTGLNIKFAEKKPCFMWEVGPSEMGFLQSENPQNEEHITSLGTCHVSDEVVKSSSCRGSQNQGAEDQLSKSLFEDGMTCGVKASGSESRSPLKIEPIMQCVPQENAESDDVEMDNVKVEKDGCFSDPFLENAQIAIFENENDEKHESESHERMESCKSVNLLTSKRKRRSSFEQQLILGGKRVEKQADEYAIKKDSSFVNWISNMLKGLKNHNVYDQRIDVCNETRRHESKKLGFQNVFQSLLSPETITQIENKSLGSLKQMVLAKNCSHESVSYMEIKHKKAESLVKQVSLYEKVSKEAPKGMFDTIRRLRLSRTDILKWMNSQLPVAHLDGFFLRLRVAKMEEGAVGSRYYVACITGLQGENPWKGLKQPIRVKVGDFECFVESQYVSNCDFLEDELIAWWQKTSKNGGTPFVKDLKSKLAERKTLAI